MVPAASGRVPRGRPYSGSHAPRFAVRLRAFHPVSGTVPGTSARVQRVAAWSYNPRGTCPAGLGWSPFARRYWGSRCCFLFLRVLRCFSSPGWLGHPGINARLTAPPGLSQSATPFIASWRPDIPHTPCVAWPHRPDAPAPPPPAGGGKGRGPGGAGRRHRPARDDLPGGASNVASLLTLRLGPNTPHSDPARPRPSPRTPEP